MKVRELLLYLSQALDTNCAFSLDDDVMIDNFNYQTEMGGIQWITSLDCVHEDEENAYIRIKFKDVR